MKKSILILATSALITGALITSCNSSSEKVEDAKINAIEANSDLNKANEEYLAEVENYREEMAEKTAANDQSIAEFKLKIENGKEEIKVEYRKQIKLLEEKNSDLKKKMKDYKADKKENWEEFKAEFNRDMEDLGNAISNFFN